MAPPPAKRQRKLLLSSENGDNSDDDKPAPRKASVPRNSVAESQSFPSKSKPRKVATKSPKGRKVTAISSPEASPEQRKRRQGTSKESIQNKSLHTFFKPATEDDRWNAGGTELKTNRLTDDIVEDQIEDDSMDEASLDIAAVRSSRLFPLDRRKLQRSHSSLAESLEDSYAPPRGSQKFAKDSEIAREPIQIPTRDRTWAERFPPDNLDEIALHKKKLADVHQCLVGMLDGRINQKVLVLKGPAGTGKSTLVSLLAQALNFSVVEWKNPATFEAGNFTSLASRFEDFLTRSGHFGNLLTSVLRSSHSTPQMTDNSLTKRILVIEEFPASISGTSSALRAFRNALLQYLSFAHAAAPPIFNTRSSPSSYPAVVIVVSETLLSSSTGPSETLTAHRLLGPEVLNHPRVQTIEFNPTAPSFVAKALELTLRKEARCSKRRRIPGPVAIKKLSECGDIRSAVNSLEFMCLRGDEHNVWSGRVAAKAKRSGTDSSSLTDIEKESLELLTQREAVVGMFHAVGKVVYNKRELVASGTEPQAQPPKHLKQHARPLKPQTSVDQLMDETGTDIQTFIATLHENYALSCNGSSSVDTLADCSKQLSDADILSTDRSHASRRFGGFYSRNSTIDTIRQNEIGFQVATCGLLFALPSPVSRAEHPKGRKGDRYKMFFPASLRLWKMSEVIDGLIDQWLSKLNGDRSTFEPASVGVDESIGEGVASWKSWSKGLEKPAEDTKHDDQLQARILTSRHDLLLERLPYLKNQTVRERDKKRDLDRITTFGAFGLRDEESSEDESFSGPGLANELANDVTSPQKAGKWKERISLGGLDKHSRENTEEKLERLYISDDDIED